MQNRLTPEEAARAVNRLLPFSHPFSEWAPADLDPSQDERLGKIWGFFEIAAWQYQFFIYFKLIEQRFGENAEALVREYQRAEHRELREDLIPFWEALDGAYCIWRSEHNAGLNLEAIVAASFLSLRTMESDEKLFLMRPLYKILVNAKDTALLSFSPIVESMEINMDLQSRGLPS